MGTTHIISQMQTPQTTKSASSYIVHLQILPIVDHPHLLSCGALLMGRPHYQSTVLVTNIYMLREDGLYIDLPSFFDDFVGCESHPRSPPTTRCCNTVLVLDSCKVVLCMYPDLLQAVPKGMGE